MKIFNPVVARSNALNPHMRLLNSIEPCASKSIIKVIAYNSKTILVVCYKIAVGIFFNLAKCSHSKNWWCTVVCRIVHSVN